MTSGLLDQVRSLLADRYQVEREVGRGGMATVFLAQDLRHGGLAALKVFRPEVAAILGKARFAREISFTANLSHPNILPLVDSGEVDEVVYYATPYIEGETLRQRLVREGQLPIDESIRVATQVAAALAHAHGRGLVHRDIKPENILLGQDGQVVVADFGIAAPLAAAGAERLTESGIVLGTPAYMSPEQADGVRPVDPRSDIYSLGCVMYEMLVGEPPFTGPTAQMILARQAIDPPRPIHTIRSTVSAELEAAILKALAKIPADRFATAAQFADALAASGSRRLGFGRFRSSLWRSVLGGVTALAVVFFILRARTRNQPVAHLDQSLVAVLPFQVSGTVDTGLVNPSALAELLSVKLTSEGGLHAVDPGVVSRELRLLPSPARSESPEAAIRLALRVGAGQALVGTVVASGARLVFDCRLLSVPSGQEMARAENIAGPSDQVLGLLDAIAARILVMQAGEGDRRIATLTSEKLPALRAYLAGVAKYRQGRYAAAAEDYERALVVDSSFALASLRLAASHAMLGNDEASTQAVMSAWKYRSRLGPRDSLLLVAFAGPRYPAPSTLAESLRQWERTVDTLPANPEAAYELGDQLFHWGVAVGIAAPWQRAAEAFRAALKPDSTLAAPLEHLIELAVLSGDTAEVVRLGQRYLGLDHASDHADYVRWRLANATGDTALRSEVTSRFATMSSDLLERIAGVAQLDAIDLAGAAKATSELRRRVKQEVELFVSVVQSRELAFNRGQMNSAEPWPNRRILTVPAVEHFQVIESLYLTGDSATAGKVVDQRRLATLGPPANGDPNASVYMDLCTRGLWESAYDPRKLRETIRSLGTAVDAAGRAATNFIPLCRLVLEANEASALALPTARRLTDSLDSFLRAGPITNSYLLFAAAREAARLEEASGNVTEAFAVVRRRRYIHTTLGVLGLGLLLREEGRLAVRLGRREDAINAYRRYLSLRANPDPSFGPEKARVKAVLDSLMAVKDGKS
jgi:serine/threonine-protein kinase